MENPEESADAPTNPAPSATRSPTPPPPAPRIGPGRYPLAHDANGNPLDVPAEAVAWRVRKGGGRRGRPRNVFTTDGKPLDVPLGATLDDLINEGCEPDRYQLYPVDVQGRILVGPCAVTEVRDDSSDDTSDDLLSTSGRTAPLSTQDTMLLHLLATVKAQSETLCRALQTTTSGYGPVRPQTARVAMAAPQAPSPILIEAPAEREPEPSSMFSLTPENLPVMLETVGKAIMAFRAMSASAEPSAAAVAPSAEP